MEKPVIFLDIDGVIHPADSMQRNEDKYSTVSAKELADRFKNPVYLKLGDALCSHILSSFDPDACSLIQKLADEFHAWIVISSSWRIMHDAKEMEAILNMMGIFAKVDLCPKGYVRRDIINQYVRQKRVCRYIVIDDMNLSAPFGFRFVQTKGVFQKSDYEKARNALQCQTNIQK